MVTGLKSHVWRGFEGMVYTRVKKCTGWEVMHYIVIDDMLRMGEWSHMIGYGMSSSLAGFYTTAKTSPVKNFKHGWNNDMVSNMATLFAKGVLHRPSVLGKALEKKTWPSENSNLRFIYISPILSTIPNFASNKLVCGLKLLVDWCTSSL